MSAIRKGTERKKENSTPSIRKLALVDPDLLTGLLRTAQKQPNKALPSSTKRKGRKRRKTQNINNKKKKKNEAQLDPFLPGGALAHPRVEKITKLRRKLDEVLSSPHTRKDTTQEAKRYRAAKLLTELTAERQRLQRAGFSLPPAMYPQEEDEKGEDEEEEEDEEDIIAPVTEVLPRSVTTRARALLNIISRSPTKRLGWDPTTKNLTIKGAPVPGSNILDLVAHVTRDRLPRASKTRPSPGPPLGFKTFARALRDLNIPREIIRNRRRWAEIYPNQARRRLEVETPRSSKGGDGPLQRWEELQ